ncbi:serine hydrolase [Motiliproteus sp. MSK22-1]|uniref:serine hydrolase domain-containing protein n=1 Tax=Motiliproteus sp. MSK22-1 TaxID=1897630 RepID=UPI0009756DF2|nr:serine hydrolase [Motiliproteus sp. MSK22-1]OMH33972.1 hypothetical protein BGP75_13485 [Motiliproteus sp. MSK22-1]
MESSFPDLTWNIQGDRKVSGWSGDNLDKAEALAESIGSNALMVIQHGQVIRQWGDIQFKSSMASVRKSIMSALIGIAVNEGSLSLEATLAELAIDDKLLLTAREKSATVADLLNCRSGVYHPSVYDNPIGRPARAAYAPGEYWFYNNWDFNVLGSIHRNAVSMSTSEAIETHLAAPLRMQDFQRPDCFLLEGGESIHPVYKLRMSCRDLARFGLLYLQGGKWKGRQVIPEQWILESTFPHTADISSYTDFVKHKGRGYGYMWWTATVDGFAKGIYSGFSCFYASGYGGQFLVVIPDLDLVVAHTVACVDQGISHEQMGLLLQLITAAAPQPHGHSNHISDS